MHNIDIGSVDVSDTLDSIREKIDPLPREIQGALVASLWLDATTKLLTQPHRDPNPSRLPEKLAYRVPEVCELLSLGRAKVYRLIESGELSSHKIGGCTVVTAKALREFVDALPDAGGSK